ncbi:MAG: Rossmann-like domain-containing protein [Halobacterium sp.]
MTDELLAAVLDDVDARTDRERVAFERVTVGDAAVLVELAPDGDAPASTAAASAGDAPASTSDPSAGDAARMAGLAHRPAGAVPERAPWDELPPRALAAAVCHGAASREDGLAGGRLTRAVGVATLNALSAPHVAWRTGDPMALLDPGVDVVVTVGLFRPAFRKFGDVEVRVVERDAVGDVATPESVTLHTFERDETLAAMTDADVVFVTGSALVYGGIARYLDAAPESATVVCIGATASMLPDAFFDAGVDVLAGAVVDDPEAARRAVADGACGTDLHDSGVRKVYAARERPPDIHI